MRGEGARGRCPFSVQLAYMLARSPFFDSILARSTTVICNFEFPDRKIGVIPSSQCAAEPECGEVPHSVRGRV